MLCCILSFKRVLVMIRSWLVATASWFTAGVVTCCSLNLAEGSRFLNLGSGFHGFGQCIAGVLVLKVSQCFSTSQKSFLTLCSSSHTVVAMYWSLTLGNAMAGVLVLEELEHAKARGVPILAEYLGGSFTCDAYNMTEPLPNGKGVSSCIER